MYLEFIAGTSGGKNTSKHQNPRRIEQEGQGERISTYCMCAAWLPRVVGAPQRRKQYLEDPHSAFSSLSVLVNAHVTFFNNNEQCQEAATLCVFQ